MSLFTDLQNAGLPVISATDAPGKPRQATFSRTLTVEEDEIYLNLLFPFRQIQKARKQNAINEVTLSEQLKTVTAQQAVDYVAEQITNGVTETQALTLFDAALTFATAKPILRNVIIGMYRTVDILKLMARMLVALRDAVMPELPEK